MMRDSRPFASGLRIRLIAILFFALLPGFVLLILFSNLEQARARQDSADESLALARLLSNQFAGLEDATRQKLEIIALFDEVRGDDAVNCNRRVHQLFARMEGYSSLYVADPAGAVDCYATLTSEMGPVEEVTTLTEEKYFYDALATKKFVMGGMRRSPVIERPILTTVLPILDDEGEVMRIVGTGRDLTSINQSLLSNEFPQGSSLLVIDDMGTILLRDPDVGNFIGTTHPIINVIHEDNSQANSAREGTIAAVGPDGIQRTYAYVTLGDANNTENPLFYAVVGYTDERATGAVERVLRTNLAGFTILILLAMLAAWVGAESLIMRRINQISATARRMQTGDLAARTGIKDGKTELDELATALDTLAASLQTREQENTRLIQEALAWNAELEARVEGRTAELRNSNARLLQSEMQLRWLSQQLMRITEQERARMSREIHDQLGQALTAIKMVMRSAQRKVKPNPDDALQSLTQATQLVDEMVILVRRIAAGLRPGILDDFGLAAAIEHQAQEFAERNQIACETDLAIDEALLPSETATVAYRIVQESLTNVARHAHASEVLIRALTTSDELEVTVQDNGAGFDSEAVAAGSGRTSLGMLGMRERAAELNGVLEVTSQPGAGTRVHLRIPLQPVADAEVVNTD